MCEQDESEQNSEQTSKLAIKQNSEQTSKLAIRRAGDPIRYEFLAVSKRVRFIALWVDLAFDYYASID